jgi:hypothetical protein
VLGSGSGSESVSLSEQQSFSSESIAARHFLAGVGCVRGVGVGACRRRVTGFAARFGTWSCPQSTTTKLTYLFISLAGFLVGSGVAANGVGVVVDVVGVVVVGVAVDGSVGVDGFS